jgi:hypothetical protein
MPIEYPRPNREQKVFIDQDADGNERRITAVRQDGRTDQWVFTHLNSDGKVVTRRVYGGHTEVDFQIASMAADQRLAFRQATQRGNKPRESMLPDRSMPMPDESPVTYGGYKR